MTVNPRKAKEYNQIMSPTGTQVDRERRKRTLLSKIKDSSVLKNSKNKKKQDISQPK